MSGFAIGAKSRAKWALLAFVFIFAQFIPIILNARAYAAESGNLDQWANVDSAWVNGNLGASKAKLREGDSVAYRLRMADLIPGSTNTVTIEWDTTQSGKRALDYLTTYNRTESGANPCTGVAGCGSATTFPIPTDPNISSLISQASGVFTMYNGTITAVSAYTVNGSYASNSSTQITLTFTAGNATPVLAWGGHIASQIDWGFGSSASSISGSPYHTRFLALNGSGGNQDRSLAAAAVYPTPILNTQVSDATLYLGESVTDIATASPVPSNGPVPQGTIAFYVCGPNSSTNPDCTTGGAFVGNSTLNTSGQATSPSYTPSALGNYCFRAQYTPSSTSPYSPQNHTNLTSECFNVAPVPNGTLIVKKVVINDNGGSLEADDFSFTVNSGSAIGFEADGQNNLSVTPGTYSVSEVEQNSRGYTTTYNNCTNVTVVTGQTTTCTITNDDNIPSLTLVKKVVNDNGGSAVASNWTLSATGGPTPISGAGGTTSGAGFKAGTYLLSESAGPAGYTASQWSCVGGTQNGASITLGLGESATCTITNDDQQAYIIVDKTVVNNNGGTAQPNDFNLKVGTNAVSDGVAYPVNPGTYTVSETNLPGYTPGLWGTDCSTTGSVTVALGETKTCTITNDDEAPVLTLIKSLSPELYGSGATGSDFTLNATKVGQSVPKVTGQDEDATDTTTDVTSGDDFQAGTYNLSEESTKYDSPAGQYTSSWECQYTNILGQTTTITVAQITLSIGESADCTVTNTFNPAKLTVIKEVINDNGGNATVGDFDISLTGKGELSFGNGQVNGSKTTYSTQTYNLNAGNYTLSELKSVGYTEGTWDCGSANTTNATLVATNLSLINGSDVTCKITNNDIAPSLTVVKNITNDNGGTATVDAFNIQLNSGTLSFGTGVGTTTKAYTATPVVEANKDYTISEVVSGTGYAATDWSCSDNATGTLLVTVNLDEAESVTCTITNNDIAPKLKLTKIVVGDNGSTAVYTDWTVTATGPTTISAAGTVSSGSNFKAGEYTLSESGPTGYTTKGWGCTGGGKLDGDKLTIGLAEDVECTITNDDKAPTLTVIKRVVNDNGGTNTVNSFGIELNEDSLTFGSGSPDGADTLKYVSTPTVMSNTPYTLSENDVAGYTEGTWSCSDGSTGGLSVSLNFDVAEDVTCTITNDDIAPKLTLVKEVVNDDGGLAKAGAWTLEASNKYVTVKGAGGATSDETFKAGTYDLSEYNGPAGYAAGDWKCEGGEQTGAQITLALAEEATCTIINDDIAPKLYIQKLVNSINNVTEEFKFDITYTQGESSDEFTKYVIPGDASEVVDAKAGTYTISEDLTGQDNWKFVSVECGNTYVQTDYRKTAVTNENNETSKTIDLPLGANITCVFTNEELGNVEVLKYNDLNENGVRDEYFDQGLEPVLEGVNFELYDGETTQQATTNSEGIATFTNVNMGEYAIYEVLEEGTNWKVTQFDCSGQDRGEYDLAESVLYGTYIYLNPGQTVECTVGNASDNHYYDIAKSNNAVTAKRVGDSVTYTLTLTIPEDSGVIHNPRVGDAPPTGFKYVSGSWTAKSNLRGNLKSSVVTEPTYASPGVWDFDDSTDEEDAFYPGEVITLTYVTQIQNDVTAGVYPDVALSRAYSTADTEAQVEDPTTIVLANVTNQDGTTPFVGTDVEVVTDPVTPPTVLVNTGSNALTPLLFGLALILAGIGTRRITATERRMK